MRVTDLGGGTVELDHPGHDADALAEVLRHGFEQGWQRVQCRVDAADPMAFRTATRAGMRQEGRLRAAGPDGADQVLLARLVADPQPGTREGFSGVLDSFMPTKRNISQALLRDPDGRVLLCETTYKRDWDLPGGMVDPGEPPSATAEREIVEELGLELPVGDLLTVAWLPPYLGWGDATLFVWDGGTHDPDLVERARLQPREIRALHWVTVEQARSRCAPYVVTLLEHLTTRSGGRGTTYLVDGHERTR